MLWTLVLHGCALLVTFVAALWDWRTGRMPNWLTLPPLVLAPLAHLALHGVPGLLGSLAGILACGIVPLFLFKLKTRAMHGGDVKLFAAIGAMIGPFLGIEAQFYAFMAAAIYSLARLAWHGKLLRTLGNSAYILVNPVLPKKWKREISPELLHRIRLGGSIFAGTLTALFLEHSVLFM
jgi:prepilin peptidase CpaA